MRRNCCSDFYQTNSFILPRTRPNERILEVDAPLSYGMADVKQEPATLNSVSFLWDPTRDTGVFVKVHCISTEFTPKKHGGERGVPFRLQVNSPPMPRI